MLAVIWTFPLPPLEVTPTVNTPALDPAGITIDGAAETEIPALLAYPSETVAPPLGAGPFSVTVHELEPEPVIVPGEQGKFEMPTPILTLVPVAVTIRACALLLAADALDNDNTGLFEGEFVSVAATIAIPPSDRTFVSVDQMMHSDLPGVALLHDNVFPDEVTTAPALMVTELKSAVEYVNVHSTPLVAFPPFMIESGKETVEPGEPEPLPRFSAIPCCAIATELKIKNIRVRFISCSPGHASCNLSASVIRPLSQWLIVLWAKYRMVDNPEDQFSTGMVIDGTTRANTRMGSGKPQSAQSCIFLDD